MDQEILKKTVRLMMAKGKGILAADESNSTADKRLADVGVEGGEESRRRYRDLFLSTPGIENYLSGVILFDETIRQQALDGTPFVEKLSRLGIVPGIKVDKGVVDFSGHIGEKITEGLEGLEGRLSEYFSMGARFAKWRAVITIGDNIPTDDCINENAKILAKYARMCQESRIVPMVEPEVILEGNHTFARSEEVTTKTVQAVFSALSEEEVWLPGVVLKTSMVLPGNQSGEVKSAKEISEATVRMLTNSVPTEAGGVAFLSGGQSKEEATENLNEIAKLEPLPWEIAFSYARAIQGPVLEVWRGDDNNLGEAQAIYMQRLKELADADLGQYQK